MKVILTYKHILSQQQKTGGTEGEDAKMKSGGCENFGERGGANKSGGGERGEQS